MFSTTVKELAVLKHTREGSFLPNVLHVAMCISAQRDFSNGIIHRYTKVFQIPSSLTPVSTGVK